MNEWMRCAQFKRFPLSNDTSWNAPRWTIKAVITSIKKEIYSMFSSQRSVFRSERNIVNGCSPILRCLVSVFIHLALGTRHTHIQIWCLYTKTCIQAKRTDFIRVKINFQNNRRNKQTTETSHINVESFWTMVGPKPCKFIAIYKS